MADRPLSVVQMLPALETGGVERGTLEVAAELARRGHRSIVISSGGQLVPQLIASGSEHVTWPVGRKSLSTLLLVRRLRRYLYEEKIDILHVRSRVPAWLGWLAWRGMVATSRPRFVTTVHGLYSVNAYSRIMTQGERVIAVSDTARQYILDNYPNVNPGCIVTIYRGVDRSEFPHGYRPDKLWLAGWYGQYPELRQRQVLTLPGRLTRLKGHGDFIELIARLVERGLPVHGLIVGHLDADRKNYIDELRHKMSSRGLTDRITFTGQRADMKHIYASSAVVLSLSNKPESFGRTVLEALSLGVPVVGYDHGGVGEVMRQLFPSGCVPVADSERLYSAVSSVLSGESPAVEKNVKYDLGTMTNATLKLYAQLDEENS